MTGDDARTGTTLADLPDALDDRALARPLHGRRPAVFLDYDGTLTPIVDDPADATLPDATREVVADLAALVPVAVVSGRDLDDVRAMVGLDGIWYAGSHGFDILAPDGTRHQRGEDVLPSLDAAQRGLAATLTDIHGARLERKRFALAIHYRQVADADVADVQDAVRQEAAGHEDLRLTGGKKIFELRPDLDWDKGRALLFLWDVLDLDTRTVAPIYVGDDVTDEDAFAVLTDELDGVGVVVRGEDDDRPTRAHLSLADTSAARDLLRLVLDLARGTP